MDAFYIQWTSLLGYGIVDRNGNARCGWFETYSEAHEHCEIYHGEVIGDRNPNAD